MKMPKPIKLLAALVILAAFAPSCKRLSRIFASGGSEFTVSVETGKPGDAEVADLAIKIIENRLDAIGIDGEARRVRDIPEQIHVRVYGDQDWASVKRFLFTTHELELTKAVSAPYPALLTSYPTAETASAAAGPDEKVLPYDERDDERSPRSFLIVESESIITGEDIRDAYAQPMPGSGENYGIAFTLRKDAAEKFSDWTGKNINSYLAIVLDNKIQSTPFIKGQIFDSGEINGRFTKASAEEIALSLTSGYLPAKLIVVSEKPFEK